MAELNIFVDDLKEQITCAICNEPYTDPRTLPCLHVLCFKCIESWSEACQKENKKLRCPTCRAVVNLNGDDICTLPTSFTYNSLLQLFNTMKIKADEQSQHQLPECIGCSKRDVLTGFCPQCEGLLCDECMTAHRSLPLLIKRHNATLLSEFNQDILNSYINNQAFCKEKFHQKVRLEYYCKTCRKCICQKCAATTHSSHDKVSIEEAADDAKKLITEGKAGINELIINYQKKLNTSNENMRRIQNEVDAAKAEVRMDIEAAIKALQDHEETLIATLDDIQVQTKRANDELNAEITADIEMCSEVIQKCETMENDNLEYRVLESYENLLGDCKTTVENSSILSRKPATRNLSVHYFPNQILCHFKSLEHKIYESKVVESVTDPAQCTLHSLSDLKIGFTNELVIETNDSQGLECYTDENAIDVQIKDSNGNNVENELTETETGHFLVKFKVEPKKHSPYKISVRIEGKEIKNSPLSLHMKPYRAMRIFGKKRLKRPISIDICRERWAAILDSDKGTTISIYNSANGQLLGGVVLEKSECDEEHPWMDRYGVICVDRSTILVSHNPSSCGCIKEYDINGTLKRTICQFSEGMLLSDMCAARETDIVCLGYNSGSKQAFIQVLGQILNENDSCFHSYYTKLGIPNDDSWVPLSIAYDDKKYFISFFSKHSVYVFDENGSQLYTIGEEGEEEGQFNFVRGLATFNNQLFVCDRDNNRIQVFTQDGHFITSFGSHGSALGEINTPVDIAVTSDGKVFVLELNGKRVQEWR